MSGREIIGEMRIDYQKFRYGTVAKMSRAAAFSWLGGGRIPESETEIEKQAFQKTDWMYFRH